VRLAGTAVVLVVLAVIGVSVLRGLRPGQSGRFRADAWLLPNEPLLGFIEVEPGAFVMGSDPQQDAAASDDEQPRHEVTLPAFFIGRYEVTVGQYRACVRDGGCAPSDHRAAEGSEDVPVRYVSWHDAMAYCGWLERRLVAWNDTPQQLRAVLASGGAWHVTLPSEAEWERAARGVNGRRYPWGNDIDEAKANYAAGTRGLPIAVGSFPAGTSPVGALDMSGNVTEWTRTHYTPRYPYPYRPDDGREDVDAGNLPDRVIRGGSFSNTELGLRAAARDAADTPTGFGFIGFRVAISPTP
jgi:formylglycine-generating enzyme required for sulfatase activity